MSQLTLHLLGPPRLQRGPPGGEGVPLEFDTRKIMALVAYLAVTGQPHTREALITLLWPELEPSRARAVLRRNLSLLRKALDGEWVMVDGETISLDPDANVWTDVDQFRSLLQVSKEHDHPEAGACSDCLAALTEAVELYQGDFLAGFTLRDSVNFDEFQFFQTEGLKDELASALARLVNYHTLQGDFDAAISYARRWLALDPLHEPAHRRLMELYAQAGRHSVALRQYRTCLRTLEEELGLPPSAETTILYEHIRAERALPVEAEALAPMHPLPHTPLPAFLRPAQDAILRVEEELVTVDRPVFVARERELARLDGYLDAALAGQGQVVFVTGGPGRGKTALMHEFARQAMAAYSDLLVASGNCNAYSGVGDPYLPFREILGMLTGDVEARWAAGTISREHAQRLWAGLPYAAQALVDHAPFLIDTMVPGAALLSRVTAAVSEPTGWREELKALSEREKSGSGDLEQRALFEQLTNALRALSARSPLLLLLDDVQWADGGSTSLLFHLGRRLEGSRILIACAYRPEEMALGRGGERHPLEDVLREFKRRFGDVWIDLARSDEAESRRFVEAFLDTEPNRLGEVFREILFQHTGGHALFAIELLRAMQERGDVVQDADGCWVETPTLDWERMPARVEAVIEARIGRLDEELRDILTVASVEGERFVAQVVAQVQSISEREALRALSQELEKRHRLVREEQEVRIDHGFLSRYQFAHALFQQYLYGELSAGERRLLHGEVASTLELLYGDGSEEIAVQLAHHYAKAGNQQKTIEYSLCAGNQAQMAYANEEAIAHFERVLDHLDSSPTTTGEVETDSSAEDKARAWRLDALRGLGRTYHRMGRLTVAERYLREAIALGQEITLPPRELVWIYHYLGETLWWQERHDDCIRTGEEGLALLSDDTDSVEAVLMEDLVVAGRGRYDELAYRRAQLAQHLPYSPELGPVCSHVFNRKLGDKNVEDAIKWLQIFEEKASSHHDLRTLGIVHGHLGEAMNVTGDLRGSILQTQRGLELLIRVGDAIQAAWCLREMVGRFLSLGDLQKAEEYADRALEAIKTVGHKRYTAEAHYQAGRVALCQGNGEKAVDGFEQALQLLEETGPFFHQVPVTVPNLVRWGLYILGRAYQARGKRVEAWNGFKEVLALARPEELQGDYRMHYWWHIDGHFNRFIANALSGLEAVCENPKTFRALCGHYRAQARNGPFVQWFLEPVGAVHVRGVRTGPVSLILRPKDEGRPVQGEPPLQHDAFTDSLAADWDWQDPFGDCSFAVQNGLEIHAANGRDLWYTNLSAPRLLRPVSGDWAVQSICTPVSEEEPLLGERPTIGGLVLWKDRENYLRLDRGTTGEHDVFFGGCLENRDVIIGRGRLESVSQRMGGAAGRVFLRLKRIGERVDALCSADGEGWFTVGHTTFPVEDPIQVGLHAIGNIDRTVYHGAYPDGTAIRFESFQLWDLNR